MYNYRRINNLAAWFVFAIAAVTYVVTAEPTTSLWDCGEFIATAYRLEVGHPPGAPLFMMLARVASLFAGENVAQVAKMVNYFSALASAFTILFLFWTITHFARRFFGAGPQYSLNHIFIIIGSGLAGALAYAFSDTFWFSAVEAEVYATSSLFTAVVFWAILKWENVAGQKHAGKWIVLIAYLMGLSIGVHLLNLLAIPAIVLVYYFAKFKFSYKGLFAAIAVSLVILATIMYGIISGVVKAASVVELMFVNGFGLPFNSGILFFAVALLGVLAYGIWYSVKKIKPFLNLALVCVAMILLGYTSYAAIVIRASANPPINENKPDNVFALLSYLNREQYGNRPLFFGQYYNAPVLDVTENEILYAPVNGRYVVSGNSYKVVYDNRFTTFFPRMYSSDPNHISVYKNWANIKGKPVTLTRNGNQYVDYVPTFSENFMFFVKYQTGQMYMRYFLWNFAGRQNDEHGSGGILKGNWLSGIDFIDNRILGPQTNITEKMKNDPSRNTYYFLPLLLGLAGIMFMLERAKRNLLVIGVLFFMTGLAIVIYLNQTPMQPRERDYAYAGSFYAFAIWIGIGVAALYSWVQHSKTARIRSIITPIVCIALVPGIMAYENYDDHNRSGRYTARAFAYNYLNSCAPNAILFTFGDNDTFPLWYLQEVEGIRTDVRVVNTMLLNTDWYITQMKQKSWLSEPLPISLNYEQYKPDKRSRIFLFDSIKENILLKDAVDFVASNDIRTKTISGYSQPVDYLPGKNFVLPVDTSIVFNNGTISRNYNHLVSNELIFNINSKHIDKSQLITLNILSNNNWQRPIYFTSINNASTCGLDEYMQLEGFAYRLVPVKTSANGNNDVRVNTAAMFNNVMNVFDYGRMETGDIYIDHFTRRTLGVMKFRSGFARLAHSLINENRPQDAIAVLNKCMSVCPAAILPHDNNSISIAKAYFLAGEPLKAMDIINEYSEACNNELNYFSSLSPFYRSFIEYNIQSNIEAIEQMEKLIEVYKPEF